MKRILAIIAVLFGFLIVLNNGDQYQCRLCNMILFRDGNVVLLVVPRGGDTAMFAGAFKIEDVKAIVELRDEV